MKKLFYSAAGSQGSFCNRFPDPEPEDPNGTTTNGGGDEPPEDPPIDPPVTGD